MEHISVLNDAVLSALITDAGPPERVIDGTLGAGGHSAALLERGAGALLGLDLDVDALALARERLRPFADRVHLVHDSYVSMVTHAQALGWEGVDAILLDLGLSSMQLDRPERGFAFRSDGPLDMRFDASSTRPSAADIVNTWDEAQLAEIFFRYGEDRFSRKIAHQIVRTRPFVTTSALAACIESAVPRPKKQRGPTIHPATRIFQALRIAVNDELGAVETVLPRAVDLLRPGGRLAVITFHSLEDRIVKSFFKTLSMSIESPPGMASIQAHSAVVKLVNTKPIVPDEAEIAHNPRSRSAKLRVIQKL